MSVSKNKYYGTSSSNTMKQSLLPAPSLLRGRTLVQQQVYSAMLVIIQKTSVFKVFALLCAFVSLWLSGQTQRIEVSLNKGWHSVAHDDNKQAYDGFEQTSYKTKDWKQVDVPHNWDDYHGYRRMRHGNRHGYAWYRKNFKVTPQPAGKRYFLFFEGVGSYATVWLNGKQVGYHPGGRTTFTLDVTDAIKLNNQPNLLAVRADHPANIKDLPWVCGGCSDERGFSEGSQPMGIFRPVHLVITNPIRIEPFGVHVWNDHTISEKAAQLHYNTELKNYSNKPKTITIINRLVDKKGTIVVTAQSKQTIAAGSVATVKQTPAIINHPHLWSLEDPYLYSLTTEVVDNGKVVDKLTTPYGIRWIDWQHEKGKSNQFLLNGKPVFINGTAEYEHLLGNSHAFTAEQIASRVQLMKAAGFNAFRDAHHPHNLRYQNYWDAQGWLWWTQMGAHVWYDNPDFRKNFKQLLTEWVKERRNSPSNVMWGLQNESKLPTDFARECTELIRQLDPTASEQRLVTTCNGGTGTDWDVPQNWTGTYGGNPATYNEDVKRQVLIGEYGAWRTLDLHTEGQFQQNGVYSEDRMTQLMEMKVRLAESVKDSAAGHYHWIFTSHDNPGRVQGGEGFRELDRIGPVNYKGLLTPWEEPLDVYYMYRSNYAPKDKEPMVYIASHTWPNRWTTTGKKDGIVVYSNCDEVELFNDVRSKSLGKRKKNGVGTHFTWDGVDINYNVLYAVGYVNGKEVAADYIVLNHLPQSPNFNAFYKDARPVTKPANGYNYVYRVNAGGPGYKDEHGNTWLADRALEPQASNTQPTTWGSTSWTDQYAGYPPFFGSQRRTHDPIKGTRDWNLFQTFRYGRDKLNYHFPVKDGEYLVELYFIEPWLGTGGGLNAAGSRLFDVAFNDKTILKDVDLWKEAGHDAAIKKTVKATVKGGMLTISFPRVAAGQAVISAIAIASLDKNVKAAPSPQELFTVGKTTSASQPVIMDWLDEGQQVYANSEERFTALPPDVFGAQWIKTGKGQAVPSEIRLESDADVYIGIPANSTDTSWLKNFEQTKTEIKTTANAYTVFKKRIANNAVVVPAKGADYLFMAVPASAIEPAYDLKPVTSYKAFNATLLGPSLKKGQVDGKDRAIFEKASPANVIEWNISTGVADTYSFTISYNNPTNEVMKGHLQFLQADGTVMREEGVEFTPTRPTKNNYINSGTGSQVNAGHYKVRLTAPTAVGLSVNALDVQ
ncbi:malectin domain-containing carbohydrate-binding protein [Aridibaculum aurantiacum]|uniref:malectin domain-containing carbohydrate-binding protein n=1 Tax=Aridibaculum aurantiacum TaxID=2810307 RepID=UPI001F604381|nr:malectin domain-containing carbohydrate-binding protein [Aridibaculum aurantiacum]